MFNYNHLYYFYITAKVGSVTKAAKALHTSQPSLSTQLKTLEAHLGRTLFRKEGRKLALTHEGRIVFSYCAKSFEATEALDRHLKDTKSFLAERVVIGVSEEIDRLFVTKQTTKVLRRLARAENGDVPSVKMLSLPHEALATKLAVSEIDILITSKSVYDRDAHRVCEVKLPVVMAGSLGVKTGVRGRETANVLKGIELDLVLPSPELKLRSEVDEFIQRHRLNKSVSFESNTLAALLQAVREGLGVGFFPLPYIQEYLSSGELKQIGTAPLWRHRILVFATANKKESSFVRVLRELLLSW